VGGSVLHVVSTATSTSAGFATVAGKGGNGVINGAAGGGLNDLEITAGAQGKLLFVSGDGGDTSSLNSLRRAGNGGNIINVRQIGANNVNVDILAGSGGSTLNFGSPANFFPRVGLGGSITGVSISGNIGNNSPTVPIKSYNDILNGERMADFVANTLLANPPGTLDDTVGNVGLVAGAAGRVQGNQSTTFAANGSVSNVSATNIMSMVA